MTDVSPNRKWVFKKNAIIVSASDSGVSCSAGLRISYDESEKTGSISLYITADLANLSGKSQILLNISPEIVEECVFTKNSGDSKVSLCSDQLIRECHPATADVSKVSTLSLKLEEPGIVLCPSEISETEFLSPAKPEDPVFVAFAKICHSQDLRLHIAARQYKDNEFDQLDRFSNALKNLNPVTFHNDHRVQRKCSVFGPLFDPPAYVKPVDPPPYNADDESESEQVAGGKRRRGVRLSSEGRKRRLFSLPQLPGSPTEVAQPPDSPIPTEACTMSTFSSRSASPSSIRPTCFKRVSRNHAEIDLMHLVRDLRGLSDIQICDLLRQSGHYHLVEPKDVDCVRPSEFERDSFAKVDTSLKEYANNMIQGLFESRVGDLVNNAVESAVNDLFFDQYQTNLAELEEQFDLSKAEVRNMADDLTRGLEKNAEMSMHEIKARAQQCTEKINDHGNEFEMCVDNKIAELKHLCNGPAKSLIASKPSLSHMLGLNNDRRGSI